LLTRSTWTHQTRHGGYPAHLISVDPLSAHVEASDDEEERDSAASPAIPLLGSAAELDALLTRVHAVVMDARYPWCTSGGTTRAQFAALAADVAAHAAQHLPVPAFVEVDLRAAPDVARRLGYPKCLPRTHVDVVLRDQPQDVPSYRVPAHSRTRDTPTAAVVELLHPAVTIVSCDTGPGCAEAAAKAVAAAHHGVALLVTGDVDAHHRRLLTAFAEAAGRRGTLRVIVSQNADVPHGVTLFKRDDADEPVAAATAHVLESAAALAAFVDSRRVPLCPDYRWDLLEALSRPGLPALKLFGHDADDRRPQQAALRAALVEACRLLRGVVVCVVYSGAAKEHAFDVKQFGWDADDLPAIGLADDVQRLNATRWAWRSSATDDGAFLAEWVRAALAGRVDVAHVTEKESTISAAPAPAPGVRRLTWTSLQREVLHTSGLAVLCLHSVHDEVQTDPQRPFAVALAQLARLADALEQSTAGTRPMVAVLRSDRNFFTPELFRMPPTPGDVALYTVRVADGRPKARAIPAATQRSAASILRQLQRQADGLGDGVDWPAALALLEYSPTQEAAKDEL
jgi:hypothetical protein